MKPGARSRSAPEELHDSEEGQLEIGEEPAPLMKRALTSILGPRKSARGPITPTGSGNGNGNSGESKKSSEGEKSGSRIQTNPSPHQESHITAIPQSSPQGIAKPPQETRQCEIGVQERKVERKEIRTVREERIPDITLRKGENVYLSGERGCLGVTAELRADINYLKVLKGTVADNHFRAFLECARRWHGACSSSRRGGMRVWEVDDGSTYSKANVKAAPIPFSSSYSASASALMPLRGPQTFSSVSLMVEGPDGLLQSYLQNISLSRKELFRLSLLLVDRYLSLVECGALLPLSVLTVDNVYYKMRQEGDAEECDILLFPFAVKSTEGVVRGSAKCATLLGAAEEFPRLMRYAPPEVWIEAYFEGGEVGAPGEGAKKTLTREESISSLFVRSARTCTAWAVC